MLQTMTSPTTVPQIKNIKASSSRVYNITNSREPQKSNKTEGTRVKATLTAQVLVSLKIGALCSAETTDIRE